jgi:mannose-6-phosphate isomerase-like protein (cupin superfamily)
LDCVDTEEASMSSTAAPKTQRFTVSHLDEKDFKTGGLRDYSAYRDLGIAAASGGLVQAHVIRMIAPFKPELSKRHHHEVQFQMVYCLKGWFQTDFEGIGVHRLEAGSCWLQPPGIRHTVVGWSDDCELLEILVPAEHETVDDPQ